ncbi:pyridoxamine 5'-phosphate oxidase family protein [Streptococcus moroccensis]|uniref:Pyridoxamine 5'-phosphate oxidase family protein n=1 Tax=Streptococcus moroccensis TaxID=1451356 RepID=A0ABT9YU21_9STRE|nr:pyridoxamine 5'-phosphate oxidase family protein [Streptococcus moroccensis]MDQ0222858.1 putative pyridoxamine 5'-phosphate oxidase family protein [Streptococcus moroccensis]
MKVKEIMSILEDMKVAVFATVDKDGLPHARHAHIGVANEKGVFFMTSPTTNFYRQMVDTEHVAITAMSQEDYLIQVIRIEGRVKQVGRDRLQELLKDNPYVNYVYPSKEEQESVQVFQLYEGQGFYHSLTQGHKYVFTVGCEKETSTRTIV